MHAHTHTHKWTFSTLTTQLLYLGVKGESKIRPLRDCTSASCNFKSRILKSYFPVIPNQNDDDDDDNYADDNPLWRKTISWVTDYFYQLFANIVRRCT